MLLFYRRHRHRYVHFIRYMLIVLGEAKKTSSGCVIFSHDNAVLPVFNRCGRGVDEVRIGAEVGWLV